MILTDSDQHPRCCLFILHKFKRCLSDPSSVILNNPCADSVNRPKFQSLCHILAKMDCKSFGHIFCRCHRICNRKVCSPEEYSYSRSYNQDVSPVPWSFLIRAQQEAVPALLCSVLLLFAVDLILPKMLFQILSIPYFFFMLICESTYSS